MIIKKKILLVVTVSILTLCSCGGGSTPEPTPTTTFTVTFNGNGGTLVSGTEVQKVSKASEIVAPTYKRDGYTFDGWDTDITKITSDTIVKAQWTVAPTPTTEFTVTFNGNGGTLVSGTEVQKVKFASELVPPTYKKSGYTFDGWDKDIESITTSTTVTAKWIVNPQTEYTIYFDLNGGSSSTCPSSKKVKSIDKDTFVYDVTKEGYNFRGWMYNNNVVFDENGNQKSTVSLVDGMTFKAKFVNTAKLHITTNNPDAVESISQDKECTYYTKVDIFAHPKQGYRFTGWYSVDKSGTEIQVSTEEEYKFQMWTEDATLSAHFDINSYKLNLWSNNPDLGQVLDANDPSRQSHDKTEISHQYLSNATISAISTTESVRFLGWYNEKNELVVHDAVYEFIMVNYDYKLEAKWNRFNITYELNGGTNDSRNPATYASESNMPLYPATKPNYTFAGWELDGQVVSSIDGSWIRHITLNAKWNISKYQVNVYSNDESKGIVSGGGSYDYGSNATVIATPIGEYVFNGWYSDSEYKTILSKDTSYTLTVPSGGISLYAKFWTKSEEEQENWNKAHGVIPVISEDGKTLTYGLYPQTHVNDSALITELKKVAPTTDEEYFLYNNEYYVKDTGDPYANNYTFSDNTTIVVNGDTYFFKCEPIKWNIVEIGNNHTIDCSNILYNHCFDDDSNAYIDSELRTWLNDDFYNKAFSIKTTSSYIVPTDLSDVSVSKEKVWIGSNSEYNNFYGEYSSTIMKKVSDFALCNGAEMYNYTRYFRNGNYWTRSKRTIDWYSAFVVSDEGSIGNTFFVSTNRVGVSPTLKIKT